MVSKQTPSQKTNSQKTNSQKTNSQKTNSQKTKTKQHSAAETVIEGRLAGTRPLDRLRQISPVTAALICAVILALGLSLWPYLAPLFTASSDDRWQADMESQLSQLRTDMQILSDQQDALTGQLQAAQDNLSGLDQQIKDTASTLAQSTDALTADIERIDAQSARLGEEMAALMSSAPEQDKPALTSSAPEKEVPDLPAGRPASPDPQPEADSLLPPLPELAVPDLSLPSISGWWQGISDWFGGLVSVERVQPEQEQQ